MPNLNCLPFMILLTNCWLLWSLNENITSSIEENAFRNGFCKMSTIFSQLSFNMLIDLMWMYFGIDIHVSIYIYIYIYSKSTALRRPYFICCISLCYIFHLLHLSLLQEYSPRGDHIPSVTSLFVTGVQPPRDHISSVTSLFVTGVQPQRDHISSVASLCYRSTAPEETTFHLLHLSLLREYLDFEFAKLKVGDDY